MFYLPPLVPPDPCATNRRSSVRRQGKVVLGTLYLLVIGDIGLQLVQFQVHSSPHSIGQCNRFGSSRCLGALGRTSDGRHVQELRGPANQRFVGDGGRKLRVSWHKGLLAWLIDWTSIRTSCARAPHLRSQIAESTDPILRSTHTQRRGAWLHSRAAIYKFSCWQCVNPPHMQYMHTPE
ncbi:hypothetical protein EDB89DRAFT_1930570 [Lactarius sanguifluus]|nr:hypothetical protein EDB89DRAFT_1930570 [Lactarius sanguifluus]